jgi:hypothetical protein
MYTLGAASYLDAPNSHEAYLRAARATNPVLADWFSWLHVRLSNFLEALLGEPAYLDDHYALPGFHIFEFRGHDQSDDNTALRAHFDLQWMHAIPGEIPRGTLSFTLPIEEPTGGCSLSIWKTRYEHAVRRGFTAVEYASRHAPQTIAYTPGRIVIHDGCILHAIGRSSVAAPEGFRITLQGHGFRTSRGWLLYW